MRIDFRQGIIRYPHSGSLQQFLSKNGNNVNLIAANGRVDITFAHGASDYLLTESADVPNAWAGLPFNTDVWIYWDIHKQTGVRTFGYTTVPPVVSNIQPVSPAENLHWFNSGSSKMFAFQGTRFIEVIRVFAAKVNNNNFYHLGSTLPPSQFSGSQVGIINTSASAGRILYDATGSPIRKTNGEFFTTEDDFYINGALANTVRFESGVVTALAIHNIAKYQVVKFSDFGKVELAGYNDTGTTTIAMSVDDIFTDNVGTCIIQGVVTNPSWSWAIVGSELWISENGLLVDVDPHISDPLTYTVGRVPVGRVLSQNSIVFDQGLGGKGARGVQGVQGNPGTVDSLELNDMTDVDLTTPQATEVLTYNGLRWVNQSPATGGAGALDELTDVDLTTPPTGGQALIWDDGSSRWIAGGSTLAHISIDDPFTPENIRIDPYLEITAPTNSGTANVYVGVEAGVNSTVGYGNVLFGNRAGSIASVIRDYNTCVGYEAGAYGSMRFSNTLIGDTAGAFAALNDQNTCVGPSAGYMSNIQNSNINIGTAAGNKLTASSNNICMGSAAGYNSTLDSNNIIVGENAMSTGIHDMFPPYTIAGSGNIALGTSAGAGLAHPTASDNILIGTRAGDMLEGGSRNIILGVDCFREVGTLPNNSIFLGNKANVPSPSFLGAHPSVYPTDHTGAFVIQDGDLNVDPFIVGNMANGQLYVNAQMSTPYIPTNPDHVVTKGYLDTLLGGSMSMPLHFIPTVDGINESVSPGDVVAAYVAALPFTITPTSLLQSTAAFNGLDGMAELAIFVETTQIGSFTCTGSGLANIYKAHIFNAANFNASVGVAAGDVLTLRVVGMPSGGSGTVLFNLVVCHPITQCSDPITVHWEPPYTIPLLTISPDRLTLTTSPGI